MTFLGVYLCLALLVALWATCLGDDGDPLHEVFVVAVLVGIAWPYLLARMTVDWLRARKGES